MDSDRGAFNRWPRAPIGARLAIVEPRDPIGAPGRARRPFGGATGRPFKYKEESAACGATLTT